MPDGMDVQKDYAAYRLERAKEDLQAAKLLYENGSFRIANNRAYYSIFHAMRSVLVFENFDTGKHSGVISEFQRKYIKAGVFPKEMSGMIGSAFMIRNASDYDDMFIASKKDTAQQIENAEYVLEHIERYISSLSGTGNSLDESTQSKTEGDIS